MSRKRRWLFRLLAVFLGLVLAELVLDVGALISPRLHYFLSPPAERVIIADPVLGHRMSPFYPGNDRLGYRNPGVPEHCDVLAVGASMTYGYATTPDKAWPRQLETMIGKSVYNMSCGGYGPCEFKVLAERGLKMSPKVVLMELYPANGIVNAYTSVYVDGRFPDLRSQDKQLLAELTRIDQEEGTFLKRANTLLSAKRIDEQRGVAARSPVRTFLSKHCALYALARGMYSLASSQNDPSPLRDDQLPHDSYEVVSHMPLRLPIDEPKVRTVFLNPDYLKITVNMSDPRIQEALRIVETLLQSLQAELKSKGIRLVVVLIPSKPLVYESLAKKHVPPMPASYFEAVDGEKHMRESLLDFFTKQQIDCVNPLTNLCSHLEQGSQLYPESDDVHFIASGYKLVAQSAADLLTKAHP